MKTLAVCCALSVLATVLVMGATTRSAEENDPALAHMVFFTLDDHSEAARQKLVDSCETLLSDIPGTTYFSVGTIAEDVEEAGVSVKDFDVALHAVFKDKATKEAYLVHPQHKQFVADNRASFAKVRVFDSYLTH